MQTLILAAVAFPIMFVLDLLWIGLIGNGFYRSQLGALMRPDIVWPAALAFYVIYAVAVAFFVISPSLIENSLIRAILAGAFFGLAAYAAYDLTNLATIKDWPPLVSFVDLAWGAFVTAATAGATYLIATRFLGY